MAHTSALKPEASDIETFGVGIGIGVAIAVVTVPFDTDPDSDPDPEVLFSKQNQDNSGS